MGEKGKKKSGERAKIIGKRSELRSGLERGAAPPCTAILSPSQTPVRIAFMVFDRWLFCVLPPPQLWNLVSGYGDSWGISSENRTKPLGETNLGVVHFLVDLWKRRYSNGRPIPATAIVTERCLQHSVTTFGFFLHIPLHNLAANLGDWRYL